MTLSFELYNYDDNLVDLQDDEAFTYEWFKVSEYYDDAAGEWVITVSDVDCQDAEYTIDEVGESDYAGGDYNTYFACYVYKNGVIVAVAEIRVYQSYLD